MADREDQTRAPWASLLDPAANARALADVQAQGLRAAGELVERLVRSVDGARAAAEAGGASSGAEQEASTQGDASSELGRIVEVWLDLLRRTADSLAAVSGARRDGVEVDVAGSGPTEPLRIVAGSGDVEPVTVWLHNGTADEIGAIELSCGPLCSSAGEVLAVRVEFDPPVVEALPARSSRGVEVRLRPLGTLAAARYRGTVQAASLPEVWLPVEVVVEDRP